MMHSRYLIPALLGLAIAACHQPADDSNIVIDDNANAAVGADIETLPPDETPATSDNATTPIANDSAPSATPIPPAFRGRWGLVAADCTSTRGDAKGLIRVGDTSIRFYESTATLKTVATNDPEHFVGNFDFAGEGQTWTRSEDLKLTGSSNTLVRTDDEGSYKYSRCDRPKV